MRLVSNLFDKFIVCENKTLQRKNKKHNLVYIADSIPWWENKGRSYTIYLTENTVTKKHNISEERLTKELHSE